MVLTPRGQTLKRRLGLARQPSLGSTIRQLVEEESRFLSADMFQYYQGSQGRTAAAEEASRVSAFFAHLACSEKMKEI